MLRGFSASADHTADVASPHSGKTLKAIARELHLSPKTASTYKARIMQKLNLQSDADLIRYALANHLVK